MKGTGDDLTVAEPITMPYLVLSEKMMLNDANGNCNHAQTTSFKNVLLLHR